ncbi:alpha/beta fold hydrolase [Larkinella ripae]
MKKHVLFIHSAGPQGARAGSGELVASLQKMLGPAYRVHYPTLPDPDNPRYDRWKMQVEHELDRLSGEVILVGHSLGGSVLVKYLSEEPLKKPVLGVCIIAAPYWGESGWKSRDFALRKSLPQLAQVPRIFLFHSRDDEVVPFSHLAHYGERIPAATLRVLNHRGHLFTEGCAELADTIRQLSKKPHRKKTFKTPFSKGA